tara:strand:- start:1129 stop:1323 length:195 start_codon:yes stop_codon:yes gene_type:complete
MKLKIPWWAVSQMVIEQIKKTILDMKEAKKDDDKITKEEWQDLLAENLLELVPRLATALYEYNQ